MRPFRLNQYDRFIPTAFPFYAGMRFVIVVFNLQAALSMIVGVVLFSAFFLLHKDEKNFKHLKQED